MNCCKIWVLGKCAADTADCLLMIWFCLWRCGSLLIPRGTALVHANDFWFDDHCHGLVAPPSNVVQESFHNCHWLSSRVCGNVQCVL